MTSRQKILLLFIGFLFAAMVLVKLTEPQPVSWKLSLSADDKIPFGCYVLHDRLPDLFPAARIITSTDPFTEKRTEKMDSACNLLIISGNFNPDPWEIRHLLHFAREGHQVFISAPSFGQSICDSLKFGLLDGPLANILFSPDSTFLNFTNPAVHKPKGYLFRGGMFLVQFERFDTSHTTVLGINQKGGVNFIRINAGSGAIFLHTQPDVFTNYHILYSNASYAATALSCLSDHDLIWDEYYKPDKFRVNSTLAFVRKHAAMRYAYYTGLLLLVLLIVTEGRRKQRPIPVIAAPGNTTAGYARTLGMLYYAGRDHAGLLRKRFVQLTEWLRQRYCLPQGIPDETWKKKLSEKSGIAPEEIDKLFQWTEKIKSGQKINETVLAEAVRQIDAFRSKCP